jgi:hypothetical protein
MCCAILLQIPLGFFWENPDQIGIIDLGSLKLNFNEGKPYINEH